MCGERDGAHLEIEEGDVAGGGGGVEARALGVLKGLCGGVGEHEGGVGGVGADRHCSAGVSLGV